MRNIGKEEWFQKLKECYRKAGRFRKSQLLDELEDLHGIHRKTAIRLLSAQKRGRKPGAAMLNVNSDLSKYAKVFVNYILSICTCSLISNHGVKLNDKLAHYRR